jgi:hypothetical protein
MTAPAIRLTPRVGIVMALAAFLGLVAFFWPFVVAPGTFGSNYAPPLIFGVLLAGYGLVSGYLLGFLLAGPAVLTTFRRAARKARFRAPVRFATPAQAADSDGRRADPTVRS